jgi:4-amino-4-deoxy-L-arabinose transferase-like glycosyltransferase
MYWYYAGFMALFGVNLYIARIGAVLLLLGSIFLLFLLAKQLTGGRPYSNAFAIFCILLYSLYPTYYGGSDPIGFILVESLLTPFCLISTLSYLMYLKSDAKERRLFFIIVAGLFSGFAIMTKLISLYFVFSLFIFHTIYQIFKIRAKHPWSESLKEYLSLLVAVLFIPIIIFIYLYVIGAWDNFYLQVIEWQLMRQSLVDTIGAYADFLPKVDRFISKIFLH